MFTLQHWRLMLFFSFTKWQTSDVLSAAWTEIKQKPTLIFSCLIWKKFYGSPEEQVRMFFFFFPADPFSTFSKCFTLLCLRLENQGLFSFFSETECKKELQEKTCVCGFFSPHENTFHQNFITVWFHIMILFFVSWKTKTKKKKKDLERLSWHWVINTGQKMDHQKNKAWREKSCLSVRPGTNSMEALRDKWGFFSFSDDPFSSACIFFFICVYKLRTGKRKQKKKKEKVKNSWITTQKKCSHFAPQGSHRVCSRSDRKVSDSTLFLSSFFSLFFSSFF